MRTNNNMWHAQLAEWPRAQPIITTEQRANDLRQRDAVPSSSSLFLGFPYFAAFSCRLR
jgi:hypothetical protein